MVGAGPGDPELITQKAKRILAKCDVLVFDNLVNSELRKFVPDHCKQINVGKRLEGTQWNKMRLGKFSLNMEIQEI